MEIQTSAVRDTFIESLPSSSTIKEWWFANLLRICCYKYWYNGKTYHWSKTLHNFLNQELFTIENGIWDPTTKSIVASKQSFTLTVSTLPYGFWIKLSCVCYLIEILRLCSLFI